MSYENTANARRYFIKRARRIYPAYFSIVIICALAGFIFSSYNFSEYWSLPLLKYIAANLLFLNFLQPNLPGVFVGNALQAVNGALWSLKIEVMFYVFVPFAVIAFRRFGRLQVLIILYIASVAYSLLVIALARKTGVDSFLELQRQLPGQLTYFIAGASSYYYFEHLSKWAGWLVSLSLVAFTFQAWLPWVAVEPFAIGILVVYFACIFPYLGNFGKYGDFSYGIYIVHFPLLQLIVYYGFFKQSPWLVLAISGVLILSIAVFFWHFIEKPFLQKSSHYLMAS